MNISAWPCLVKYLGWTSDRIVYRARPVVIVLVLVLLELCGSSTFVWSSEHVFIRTLKTVGRRTVLGSGYSVWTCLLRGSVVLLWLQLATHLCRQAHIH